MKQSAVVVGFKTLSILTNSRFHKYREKKLRFDEIWKSEACLFLGWSLIILFDLRSLITNIHKIHISNDKTSQIDRVWGCFLCCIRQERLSCYSVFYLPHWLFKVYFFTIFDSFYTAIWHYNELVSPLLSCISYITIPYCCIY